MEEKLYQSVSSDTKRKAQKLLQLYAKDEILCHLRKWYSWLVIKGDESVKARLPGRKHSA